jgi:hypothetical protein
MYSSQAIFLDSFEKLTQRWNRLGAMEALDVSELNQLRQKTLKFTLDVSLMMISTDIDFNDISYSPGSSNGV